MSSAANDSTEEDISYVIHYFLAVEWSTYIINHNNASDFVVNNAAPEQVDVLWNGILGYYEVMIGHVSLHVRRVDVQSKFGIRCCTHKRNTLVIWKKCITITFQA